MKYSVFDRSLAGTCAAVAALTVAAAAPSTADPNNVNPVPVLNGTTGLPLLSGPTKAVFQQTGMASPNRTERFNVVGTDLGIMWDDGHGGMLTAYGDSAGLGIPNLLAGSIWAWTSNSLFRSHTTDPAHGIAYDDFVPNPLPSPKIPGIEISFIPTAGIAVGDVQFMSLMSVREWGPDGKWETNFCTLATSTDGGRTWAQLPNTRRADVNGFQKFQMNAFLKDGEYVYKYGTPAGRNNPGFVSRVRGGDIATLDRYEYWDGDEWKPQDADTATPIVGGVGELSVMWNDHLHRYVMLTTDPQNSVVMRTATAPQGPWGEPRVLIDTRDLPSAYAPMIFPYQTGDNLYFLVTIHNQYNVVLMRTPL